MSTTIGIDRTTDRAVFEQSLLTPAARRYAELQARVLAGAGVAAHSRFVRLAEPAIRGHVLEVGSGAPVVLDDPARCAALIGDFFEGRDDRLAPVMDRIDD